MDITGMFLLVILQLVSVCRRKVLLENNVSYLSVSVKKVIFASVFVCALVYIVCQQSYGKRNGWISMKFCNGTYNEQSIT